MTGAARRLAVTQPALSRSLKLLAEELEVTLFERRPRKLTLTSAGRALVPRARAIFDAGDELTQVARRAARRDYFDVRIGCIDSVATYLLPRALTKLQTEYPGLAIKLRCERTPHLLDQIEAGRLDVALCAHSGPPPRVQAHSMARYRLRYYGRTDRFAELASCRTRADVDRFPLVRIVPRAEAALAIPSQTTSYAIAANTATVKAMVLAGFGVGNLLSFMLSAAEQKKLVCAPIDHDPKCRLYLVTAESWTGRTHRDISKTLQRAISQQLKPNR